MKIDENDIYKSYIDFNEYEIYTQFFYIRFITEECLIINFIYYSN